MNEKLERLSSQLEIKWTSAYRIPTLIDMVLTEDHAWVKSPWM